MLWPDSIWTCVLYSLMLLSLHVSFCCVLLMCQQYGHQHEDSGRSVCWDCNSVPCDITAGFYDYDGDVYYYQRLLQRAFGTESLALHSLSVECVSRHVCLSVCLSVCVCMLAQHFLHTLCTPAHENGAAQPQHGL